MCTVADMPSPSSYAERVSSAVRSRDAQRLETRARVFDAAVAEIGRSGLAGADVSAIARAAGVVRGTFYFHFPTKEHVLTSMLSLLVSKVLAAERRLGAVIFRDMLGLHFSSTRPVEDALAEHPLAEFVIAAIAEAQGAGRVPRNADHPPVVTS